MFFNKSHIHFMGINGIGMSGIAKILLQKGYTVSGCDITTSGNQIQDLKKYGCSIASCHQDTICSDPSIQFLVHTTDIRSDHPEIIAAHQKGIKVIHRADMLAEIMRTQFSIAIAGSHGKTTTTSLATHMLLQLDQNPTFIIGGQLNSVQTNAQYGSSLFAVAEADESDRSFLKLPKAISIVTNIDLEHLETYANFEDIKQTFIAYMNQLPFYGTNIVCLDDAGIQSVLPHITTPVITYGTHPKAHIRIENIQLMADESIFDIVDTRNNMVYTNMRIPLLGLHNVLNATSIITLGMTLSLNLDEIQAALGTFSGVDRRFTIKGVSKRHQATIVDDYGHHPEEIRNTILVARKKSKGRLIMLFQPHRHTRTQHLWHDFITVLSNSDLDMVIITDIFAKGEQAQPGFSSYDMVRAIQQKNPSSNAVYIPLSKEGTEIIELLHQTLQPHDLLLLQGAGKINSFASDLLD
ncbi:UDP-N-acetylmuramate--L-alanine ligase [Candidatus Babeliales bacterium]|nr:UDP-N-acetylmuramate--L-alanine ligase [Candidatus Babeliales bacterium]